MRQARSVSIRTLSQKIESVLVESSCAPVRLSDKSVWRLQQEWRQVYARNLHAERGTWTHAGFDWHVFTFEHYPYQRGNGAWARYRALESGPFVVLSAEIRTTFGFSCTGKPPETLDRRVDILVAPPSMEWTMTFDHEALGPFFATAS